MKPDSDVLFSARHFVVFMDCFLKSVIYRFTDLLCLRCISENANMLPKASQFYYLLNGHFSD